MVASTGTVTLAGGNNITLSTGASAITISGPNTHAAQTGISGLANSQTTYTSGTVNLSVVAGNLTIRSTTGQAFQFSASQSVQAETQTFVGGIANSETTYTSGTVSLVGTNNITVFSTTGQAFRISGANTHAQQTGVSGIANSQTTYTSGTVSLSELGAITIRSTTGNQYQFSVNAQSVQAETQTFIGGIGNTATTYTSGTVELEGTNNITVFSTTGQRFRISGANTHAQQTAISGLANSETTYTSGTVSFSELGAVTFRSTTGNQFQISVNSQTVQTQDVLSVGVSTGGNTQGNTTVNTGSRLVFVGTSNITLSQATAAGATTISISGPNAGGGAGHTYNGWNPLGHEEWFGQDVQGAIWFFQWQQAPDFQYDRVANLFFHSNATNSSGSWSLSRWMGIYTKNVSTMSLLASTSSSWAVTNSGTVGIYSSVGGIRLLTIPWTSTLSASDYYIGIAGRTSTAGANGTYQFYVASQMNSTISGMFSAASNTSVQLYPGIGVMSVSSTAVPNSVAFSDIQGGGGGTRWRPQHFEFLSGTV